MAIQDLKGSIVRLPEQPGVYLFLGPAGETLYVGKARVLRDRVRSYLGAVGASPRIDALLSDVTALETIVTDSVVEALALENRLIKQRHPKYNVLLRDDKTYPYLQLTTGEPAPRLLVARQVERDGHVYAGPFMPASIARRTMTIAHRYFGIRSCNEHIDGQRGRPCLEYDIKRCLAPCVASICSLEAYGRAVDETRLLLEGRQDELIDRLVAEMQEAAALERFERAAHLRDAIRTVEALRDRRNRVEAPAMGDRDVFGAHIGAAGAIVEVFLVRHGRVVDRVELVSRDVTATGEAMAGGGEDERDVFASAVQQFYADRTAPADVHVPVEINADDREALEAWLSARAGRRVAIAVPRRGEKKGLLDLVARNAALAYRATFAEGGLPAAEALELLRAALRLPVRPRRIECFDISTLHGRETVASMTVLVDGRLARNAYRRFRIRGGTAPGPVKADDFAAMSEVVRRRYQRALASGGPFPDLVVIDGGKGQLNAAYQSLAALGLESLVAVGLAKEEELLFTRDRDEPLALPRESPALRLLQRVRDEAHRFAVTFHRRSRTRADLRSGLDEIAGVGPRRRRQLLTAFGSLAGVRRASRADLEGVVGRVVADAVIRHFAAE
jgi:excinuclease ABC subunit C